MDETVLRQRATIGMGAMATGLALVLALAVVPAVTASASSNTSAICKVVNADEAKSAKGSASLLKAMEAGNWPVTQKKLLSTIKEESGPEKAMVAALSGAPAKVKAAADVSLSLVRKLKTIVENAKSLTQFQKAITAAESSPKFNAPQKVLESYATTLCGPGAL